MTAIIKIPLLSWMSSLNPLDPRLGTERRGPPKAGPKLLFPLLRGSLIQLVIQIQPSYNANVT